MLNLTPHAIVVVVEGVSTTFPPSGVVARVSCEPVDAGFQMVGNDVLIPVICNRFGDVTGVPALPCQPFLVSGMVLAQLGSQYSGVAFAPATGPADGCLRDEKGHIVGVTKLVTI